MKNLMKNINDAFDSDSKNNLKQSYSPQEFGKVAVLFGGQSPEREISLLGGEAVLSALLSQGVDAIAVDPDEYLVEKLKSENFARAFVVLHGTWGEDGVVQGVLEMLGIPYTGSKLAASALAMDKLRSKLVMQSLKIPTPPCDLVTSVSQVEKFVEQIGFPIAIKPNDQGSSLGVTRVNNKSEIKAAFLEAKKYGDVLAEKWIQGKDFFVSILDDVVLPPVQVSTKQGFYDYQAKYFSNETNYICPAPLPSDADSELKKICLQAFKALGCTGWGRVDVMQDANGAFWVLEVNTIPGMTSHSLVPMSAKQIGMSFEQLVIKILATTLDNYSSVVGDVA